MLNRVKPFRFWCQKVLPLVYDESLSYYELLCKVVDYLNRVIEDVNTLADDVEEFEQLFIELRNYVNNYFDNLDVQQEINHKLDEMAEDGTLATVMEPLLDAFRDEIDGEMLEQNIRIQTLESRMSEFTSLEEGSTTGDAELADIRVGADGHTYTSAGDAVRGQFLDLYGVVVNNYGYADLGTIDEGYYIKTASGAKSASAAWNCTDFLPVHGNALLVTVPEHDNATTLANVGAVCFYTGTSSGAMTDDIEPIIEGTVGEYQLKVIEIPEGARSFRASILAELSDTYRITELYSIPDMIDNDEIKVYTRINYANQTYGFNASSTLIKLKKSVFTLDVTNNNASYTNAWEATWNAYYWLMNHPDRMFATNCNYSGGTTTSEVRKHHYPMRYNGVDYPEGDDGQPVYITGHTRPFFAIDTENQNVKWFPMDTTLNDIPATYNYAFACDTLLIKNGQDVRSQYDPFYGGTPQRMPRNVFGWDDDYFYIWFCEGRNDIDGGYTKEEICNRLINSYGVQNAVNLDGGGSVCIAANTPNTVKVNAYKDATQIRPTTLNLNYKYTGGNYNMMPLNARTALLQYMANVYHPVKADMLRVLSTINGAPVKYVYHQERSGYYKLEVSAPGRTLDYITFSTFPQTTYQSGAELNLAGATVVAVYTDGSNTDIEDVTEQCTFTPADGTVLTSSDTSLTATYTEGGTTKTVTIPLTVS